MTVEKPYYKVLIIDDSDTDRALIDAFLGRSRVYKFQTDYIENPEESMQQIKSGNYDCVLVDYNMPEMSGMELIHALNAESDDGATLPVALILLTGQGDESVAVEAIRHGAEDYLIKDRLQNGVLPRAIVKAVDSYELRHREKAAAIALASNEQLLREMAETIPQFIWVSTPDGETTFVNNRWLDATGLRHEEIDFSKEKMMNLVHPEDRVNCRKCWLSALDSGRRYKAEFRMRVHDSDEWRWFLCRSHPVKDKDGNILNWFGTCTDVHELRQAQHELLQREDNLRQANDELKIARDLALSANRAKSLFLASMSHEFRTPLNAVIGYAEMLTEEAEDNLHQQQVKDLGRIRSAAQHLLALIDDVLDIARVEAGEMSVNIKKIDLAEIVWDAVSTSQWLIDKNNNELDVQISDQQNLPVYGDPTRIRQIIFNLLSNAAKFTSNGKITVSAVIGPDSDENHKNERMVQIQIEDTGIGITEANQQKLFTPFYRGDSLVANSYGGTGLGLAISRNLCRMMNGDITVQSTQGEGSIFTLTLPLASAAPTTAKS